MILVQAAVWHTGAWRWYSIDDWLVRQAICQIEHVPVEAHP
jgi:hypothetical protein